MEMAPGGKSGNSDSSYNTAAHVDAVILGLYAEIQNFLRQIMVKQNLTIWKSDHLKESAMYYSYSVIL